MSVDHLATLAAGGRLGGDQEEEGDVRGRGPVGGLEVGAGKDDRTQAAWCLLGAQQLIFSSLCFEARA